MNEPSDSDLRLENLIPDLQRIRDLIRQSESLAPNHLRPDEALAEAFRLLSRNLEALCNNDPFWQWISTHSLYSESQGSSTTAAAIERIIREGLEWGDIDHLVKRAGRPDLGVADSLQRLLGDIAKSGGSSDELAARALRARALELANSMRDLADHAAKGGIVSLEDRQKVRHFLGLALAVVSALTALCGLWRGYEAIFNRGVPPPPATTQGVPLIICGTGGIEKMAGLVPAIKELMTPAAPAPSRTVPSRTSPFGPAPPPRFRTSPFGPAPPPRFRADRPPPPPSRADGPDSPGTGRGGPG
jgi:hypothetical protein